MFWRFDEQRMVTALELLRQRITLSAESETVLDELVGWLAARHQEIEEEWSHVELLDALISDPDADTDDILDELRDSLASMEVFATTLVQKLSALRATVDDDQKAILAAELSFRGRNLDTWNGWHRHRRLRHRGRSV